MLPKRYKRYASADGDIPRLMLATNQQLVGLALLMFMLLVAIFPYKSLQQKINAQQSLDDLTLAYIQNFYRAQTDNDESSLLLARLRQSELGIVELKDILAPALASTDPAIRSDALIMLARSLRKAAVESGGDEKSSLRKIFFLLLDRSQDQPESSDLSLSLSATAFALDLPDQGYALMSKVYKVHTESYLESMAKVALKEGQTGLASALFLHAMDRSTELTRQRSLFQQGIDVLMSASQYTEALTRANQHIGPLADDLPTIRYMVRISLAAGSPSEADRYAKSLVYRRGAYKPAGGKSK